MNLKPKMNSTPRTSALFAVAAVTVGALAGCAHYGPSDLDTPEVLWPDGAPDSAFEDDPAVIALREAYVQEAVAWNHLDYSDPDLIYRWGFPMKPFAQVKAPAGTASERIADGRSQPREWTMLGPAPLTIYEVQTGQDFTIVVACSGPHFVQYDPDTGEPKESLNQLEQFKVTFFPDGSSHITSDISDRKYSREYFQKCKDDSPVRGVFDPEPEPFNHDENDLKRPLPPEEYGFDNIS